LLTDQDKIIHLHRESSIDAVDQISVRFAKLFQRRRFLEIDESEAIISCVAMFVSELQRNEHASY
jgi:hypothetical protein